MPPQFFNIISTKFAQLKQCACGIEALHKLRGEMRHMVSLTLKDSILKMKQQKQPRITNRTKEIAKERTQAKAGGYRKQWRCLYKDHTKSARNDFGGLPGE